MYHGGMPRPLQTSPTARAGPGSGGMLPSAKPAAYVTSRTTPTAAPNSGAPGAEGLYGVGLGVSVAEGRGFWINSVKPGGPADLAGLRKGDLIVTIDNKRPGSLGWLRKMLLGAKGSRVDVGILRPNSTGLTSVSVFRGGGSMAAAPVLSVGMGFKQGPQGVGFLVTNVQPGGPAERAGVQSGDLILTYNGESVSLRPGASLPEALADNTDPIVRFGVRRGESQNLISAVVVRTPLNVTASATSSVSSSVSSVPSPSASHSAAPAHAAPPSANQAFANQGSVPSASSASSASSGANQGVANQGFAQGTSAAAAAPSRASSLSASSLWATPASGSAAEHPAALSAPVSASVSGVPSPTKPVPAPSPVKPHKPQGGGSYTAGGGFTGGGYTGGYTSTYDSDKSDNYNSSAGSYSTGRASFMSDSSRDDAYSSDDSRSRHAASPHTYVERGGLNESVDSDHEPPPIHHRPVARKQLAIPSAMGESAVDVHAPRQISGQIAQVVSDKMPDTREMDLLASWREVKEMKDGMEKLSRQVQALGAAAGPSPSAAPASKEGEFEVAERRREEGEARRVTNESARSAAARDALSKVERESERVEAESVARREADVQQAQLISELRTLVEAAGRDEVSRKEAEERREEAERERGRFALKLKKDLEVMRDEQDGMLEGIEELRATMKLSVEELKRELAKKEEFVHFEINKIKVQVLEAVAASRDMPVVFSNSTPTTIVSSDLTNSDYIPYTHRKSSPQGVNKAGADRLDTPRNNSKDSRLEVMPSDGAKGLSSPLIPRLRLKHCISDDAVPPSLRCQTLVVGKRLILFPKGRDGMFDLQFAMVMDLVSLRVWALRVMGSLPLRCRCELFVVGESVCIFPTDSAGRADLKQAFILKAAEEDRVYSQGCYVELDVPATAQCQFLAVGRSCLIFIHDGEGHLDLASTCVLDTELLTLRVCGKMLPSPQDMAGHASPLCTFATVGLKVVLFLQDAARHWLLRHTFVFDANLGMLKRQVELGAGATQWPAAAECTHQRIGDRIFVFPHSDCRVYDFEGVWVLDTATCRLSPVSFVGHQPTNTNAQIMAIENTLVIIPQKEDLSHDYSQVCLIDTAPPGTQMKCQLLTLQSVGGLPTHDSRLFQVGTHIYAVSSNRRHSNVVGVLSPLEGKGQAYAAAFRGQSTDGFDVEVSGTDLVFVPYDANGRRCVGDISILDCTLLQ